MATSVGQIFEVYASKSEADAKALASSKPGAMCFTTDTHRIVFNGVVYNLVEIINNLTDGNTNKALSAAQGKVLKALIDALPTVSEMNTAISSKLGSVYKVMGTKANISEVLALTNAVKGDTWNVTAEFTLGNKKYPAGTNVVCVTNTSASDHNDDNWDALGGTVDLSVFLKAADAASMYLKKKDAESTYVTKTEFDALDKDYNTQLSAVSKALNEKLAKTDVVNNLTTTSTGKALDAAQGAVLKDSINTKINAYLVGKFVYDSEEPVFGSDNGSVAKILGSVANLKQAIDKGTVIQGTVAHDNHTISVLFCARNKADTSQIELYGLIAIDKIAVIRATYAGANWNEARGVLKIIDSGIEIK